jgi:hypothetical protein
MLRRMCLKAGWVSVVRLGACSTHPQYKNVKKVSYILVYYGSIPYYDGLFNRSGHFMLHPGTRSKSAVLWSSSRESTGTPVETVQVEGTQR